MNIIFNKESSQIRENLFSSYFNLCRELPSVPENWPSLQSVADFLSVENPPMREAYQINPPGSPQERAEIFLSQFFKAGQSYLDFLFSRNNPDRNHSQTPKHWDALVAMFPGGPLFARQLSDSFKGVNGL